MSPVETIAEELERLRKFEVDVYIALAHARIPRAGGPGIELLTRGRDDAVGQLSCAMYLLHGDECDDAPCEDDECCWCQSLELLYPAAEEPKP